jgi:arylsulfatase A-like enzyme
MRGLAMISPLTWSMLRDLGLLDQTAVVVTSDHGEGLGDHGHMAHGWNLHEELVRIPLIVRAPGIPRNSRLLGPVQLEDLMPTLLALMGLRAPEGLDGRNLLPWIRGCVPLLVDFQRSLPSRRVDLKL